jgi:hypothetical protein
VKETEGQHVKDIIPHEIMQFQVKSGEIIRSYSTLLIYAQL